MTNTVKVPDLGDGIDRVEVALWHKKVGDPVTCDEDIVEVVTDKASFNVPASASGIIKNIYVKEGQEAAVGAVLADIV
jgi:pyruvate/2-oxoglutarate dehydrogenase complex dihydrolipoamide acyltransferase (E2) component